MFQGKCKKCGNLIKIRQGKLSREEIIELLKKKQGFECPGHHVELSSPYPFYWNIDEWEEVEDPLEVSEEDWLKEIKAKYQEVLDCDKFYGLDVLKSFAFGLPITTDGKSWNFANSPEGKRYYFCGLKKEEAKIEG